MYRTGNTTKNGAVLLSQNIAVNEECPNIDFRYGPYSSVEEAEGWLDTRFRALGLTVGILEEGKIVEYWFKTNTTHLEKKIDDAEGIYTPSDSIPNNAVSEIVSARKSSLAGKTISEILDKILFKDQGAYVRDNSANCKLTANSASAEVGTSHSVTMYTATAATADYGYDSSGASGSKKWTVGEKSLSPTTTDKIVFGENANSCSCKFTLTEIPLLYTNYGNTPASLPSYTSSVTRNAYITGYYKCAFSYSSNYSWNTFNVSKTGKTVINTTKPIDENYNGEYVYVAVPTVFSITAVEIHHPLLDTYVDITSAQNLSPIDSNTSSPSISNNYRFKIYKLAKAKINASGHPTGNSQPMRITISK